MFPRHLTDSDAIFNISVTNSGLIVVDNCVQLIVVDRWLVHLFAPTSVTIQL